MKNSVKEKTNSKSIFKKITMATLAIGLSVAVFAINMNWENPYFSKYRSNYNSDLAYIKEGVIPVDSLCISMTEASELNEVTDKIITIENSDELNLFSSVLNNVNKSAFLGYDYALIDNIDWESEGQNTSFTPIKSAFTGTFDGQGYEVINMNFNGTISSFDMGSSYYSMFNFNEGTIKDLGLKYPKLTVSVTAASDGTGGASYLVGNNKGNITGCFVVDDKTGVGNSGITANDWRIATFVVDNDTTGKLINNYVVVDSVVSNQSTSTFASFGEITLTNSNSSSNSISNCYYYNKSIESYNRNGLTYYRDTYVNLKKPKSNSIGDYCANEAALKQGLNSTNTSESKWYFKDSYGSFSVNMPIDYAVRRGLEYNNSTKTFTVSSEKDFAYMYELFNGDDNLASNEATYCITKDLNLAKLPVKSYTYSRGIGANIIGSELASNETKNLTLINDSKSGYPTIYNAKIMDSSRVAKSVGVDCYGLFNFVTGTIKNLNVYVTDGDANLNDINTTDTSNVKGIGVLAGYIEKGSVENVHVYANFTNSSNKNIDEYYLGGIAGILGGSGNIKNSSAAGSINLTSNSSLSLSSSSFMKGIAIGGVVGYIEESLGNLNTCTNAIDINCELKVATDYAIGGIAGAGYTTNYNYKDTLNHIDKTANLENVGNINIGSTYHTYDSLYVAGIIGRHLGMTDQVENYNNSGKINVVANGNTTFVAGCENADILTSAISNTRMTASQFIGKSGNRLFYASSFTNGEEITVTGSSSNLYFTNVLNIDNRNKTIETTLDGIFNLAYNEKYINSTKRKAALATQEIDMNFINEFAPVLNVIGSGLNAPTTASQIYNFRSINYKTTASVASNTTFKYTGVILGDNISYTDIRNEGDLTFNLSSYEIGTGSILRVSGLFDTLNDNFIAGNLFNGGNITVIEPSGSTVTKHIDMYLSGICYQNLSDNDSNEQNPLKADFDKELNGTLYNAINNGDITVSSENLEKDTPINATPETTPGYDSNIYVGGITYLNKGIISSTFNLGNIQIEAYSNSANKKYYAGGISCVMDGRYAQIRDAANNGKVYAIDAANKNTVSHVIVGGIVANNTSITTNNNQVIAFTINYGEIMGFQGANNMTNVSVANAHSIVGGVLGYGLCNLVNIVNYGNAYGNECVAGIASVVGLGDFGNDVTTIANTLSYGKTRINPQYHGSNEYQTYNTIISKEYLRGNDIQLLNTAAGSIISVFDFASKSNIKIRYLINFYSGAPTVLYSLRNPASNKPDISTFITATGPNDEFAGNTTKIKYGPLTTVTDSLGNVGVFSSDFILRQIINGRIEDGDSRYNTELYVSDSYIKEFYEFINFDKVNPNLLESIGWASIAYEEAAEALVKNVSALATLVNNGRGISNTSTTKSSTTLLSAAFSDNGTWLDECNTEIINSLVTSSLDNGVLDGNITDFLEYLLTNTSVNNEYSLNVRKEIITVILNYYQRKGIDDYYEVLQSLLVDEIVAKIISEDTLQYKQVKEKISELIQNCNNKEEIIDTYISILESNDILGPLFDASTASYYEQPKIDLVTTLLAGYDDTTVASIYYMLDISSESQAVLYEEYLKANPSIAREIYIHLITNHNLDNVSDYIDWANNTLNKNDLDTLIDDSSLNGSIDSFPLISSLQGYKYSQITTGAQYTSSNYYIKTLQNLSGQNITSLNVDPTVDYSSIWNIIKYNSNIQDYIEEHYFDSNGYTNPTTGLTEKGIIAKATEYNNSYQTNDRPMSSYGIQTTYDSTRQDFYEPLTDNQKYYGGINYGGANANLTSFYGTNTITMPINTRFIYTPNDVVSYRTSYLGPYSNTSGMVYNQVTESNGNTPSKWLSSNGYDYNIGKDLTTVDTEGEITRGTIPFFVSLSESEIGQILASSGTRSSNLDVYRFHWNDNNTRTGSTADIGTAYQWKQENFMTYAPTNTNGYLYNNYNSGDYMKYYFDFDPTYVPTINADKQISTTLPNGVELDSLVNKYDTDQFNYSDYFLTGYASSAIITGVWYTYSVWKTKDTNQVERKCVSLVAKNEPGDNNVKLSYGKYFGVHTTDYICYDINDLINLDGVKTKGMSITSCGSNPNYDEDEINIISALVTKLLEDCKDDVLKAISAYSKNHDFSTDQSLIASYLLSSISDTDIALTSIRENILSLLPMYYSNDTTIEQFLIKKCIESNYRDKLIASIIGNEVSFKQFLIYMLNTTSGLSKKFSDYEDFISNYTKTNINDFIYDYLKYVYKQNGTITESDINLLFGDVDDSDLDKIENIFKLVELTSKTYDEYAYNSYFKLYNMILYTSKDSHFSGETYDNVTYDRVLMGIDNTSYIEFPVDSSFDDRIKYSVTVVYKGTIRLDDTDSSDRESYNNGTDISSHTYSELVGLDKKLYVRSNTQIFSIELKNYLYEEITSRTYGNGTEVTSPFASVTGTTNQVEEDFYEDPYKLTTDTTFQAGKEYYTCSGEEYHHSFTQFTNFNVDQTITGTYYEKIEYKQTVDTKFLGDKGYYTKNGDTYERETVTLGADVTGVHYELFNYKLTSDTTFVDGKTYYIQLNDTYQMETVTTGDPIPTNTYYEFVGGDWNWHNRSNASGMSDANNNNSTYGNSYSIQFKLNNQKGATTNIKITKGSGITYNDSYVTLKFKVRTTVSDVNNYGYEFFPTVSLTDSDLSFSNTPSIVRKDADRYEAQYEVRIPVSKITSQDYTFGITTYIEIPSKYYYLLKSDSIADWAPKLKEHIGTNNNSTKGGYVHNRYAYVCDFHLESSYYFDYTDATSNPIRNNVQFDQNIKNAYYNDNIRSNFTISTNSNVRSFIETNTSGLSKKTIIFNQPNNDIYSKLPNDTTIIYLNNNSSALNKIYSSSSGDKINGALKLKPFSASIYSYPEGSVYSSVLSPLTIKTDASLNTNFNNDYYDVSDPAKYIVKDYLIRQDLTADSNGYRILKFNDESYVEFNATGQGVITIYDANNNSIGTISVDDSAKWFELNDEGASHKYPRGTYKYRVTSGTVSINEVVSVYTDYIIDEYGIISNTVSGSNNVFVITAGGTDRTLINFDFSALSLLNGTTNGIEINSVLSSALDDFNNEFTEEGTSDDFDKYTMFIEVYPYINGRSVSGKTLAELREDDIFTSLATLFGTMKWDANNNSYFTIFANDETLTNTISAITSGHEYYLTKTVDNEDVALFNDSNIKEIIELLGVADKTSFSKLYSSTNSNVNISNKTSDHDSILMDLASINDQEFKLIYAKKLWALGNANKSSSIANYIYGAYLGNDYLNKINAYTQTLMYELLDDYSAYTGENYQFIISNTTVDSQIVTKLINHIANNSNISIDGYGIFALSSSHGIGYGVFIPDNVTLSTLDVYYDESIADISSKYYIKNSSNEYVLASGSFIDTTYYVKNGNSYSPISITIDEYNASRFIIVLLNPSDDDTSSYWRGGDDYSVAEVGTVDYAFYQDMKQLLLSISTDVFELDFNDNSIKSVDDQIDNENATITYYFTDLSTYENATLTISKKSLANGAKIATFDNDSLVEVTEVSLTGATVVRDGENNITSITKENAFTVYAEDTGVSKRYTIRLIAISENMTISINASGDPISASGGILTVTVTGTNMNDGMDLEPYIHILKNTTEYSTSDGYWKLDPSFDNNAIVNNNSAIIKISIDKKLPGGSSIVVKLDVLGKQATDTFDKTLGTGKTITKAIYQGTNLFESSTSKTTDIPFGRAFNYSELVDYESDDFYLYEFEYSDNATVEISATYSSIMNGSVNTGRIKYTVTYVVTAEDTSEGSTTYTHVLQEMNYFDNETYASLYVEGETVKNDISWDNIANEDTKTKYLYDGTFTYNNANDEFNGSEKSSLNDSLKMHIAYNRAKDREPQYRVKYILNNFYTLGSLVTMEPKTYDETSSKAAIQNTYAGITVTVSNNNTVGKYTFVYTYKNTGTWISNDEEVTYETYERYYEFPELIIEKLASTDALLHKITFLEEAINIGNTATVILPNTVLISKENDSATVPTTDSTDQNYDSVFRNPTKDIQVTSSGINYLNGKDAPSISDYFTIGTVSNADLAFYCPTFGIDDYAQMYQYTTLVKLTQYGAANNQSKTDKELLTNHTYNNDSDDDVTDNVMFLYVPFTNGTDVVIFLVELDENGYWTNVYRTTFNGNNGNSQVDDIDVKVGAFPSNTINISNAKEETSKVTNAVRIIDKNGQELNYWVDETAGNPTNNQSLYMDYVGTPLDGHFWYVSYVIFSEEYINGGNTQGNIRYYHISIIDLTNTIQFYVTVYAPKDEDFANIENIYLTISVNIYDEDVKTSRQISAHAVNREVEGNLYKYTLAYDLQALPSGYFYFYVDIPTGYLATAYTDMHNQLDPNNEEEAGSFLPKTSIITQKVNLEIDITAGSIEDKDAWAVAISDSYTVMATYNGSKN